MRHLIIVLGVLGIIAVIVYALPDPPPPLSRFPLKWIAYIVLAGLAIIELLGFAGIV